MAIKKYIICICFSFVGKPSLAQNLSNEFIKEYREAFYGYAGLDTSFDCINSIVVLQFNLSNDNAIMNITSTPGISKEMEMKFKVALKRTEPLWKELADTIYTKHPFIQLLYFEDDTGCLGEAKTNSNTMANGNEFHQMKKMRDISIIKSSFNMLSLPELKTGAFMLPAIIIKKTQ